MGMWLLYLTLTALLIAATVCVLAVVSIAYVRRKYCHLPSPKMTSFFFGHYLDIQRERQKNSGENPPDELLLQWSSEVGNIFILFFTWKPVLVVLNPCDVEAIHMTPLHSKPKAVTNVTGDIFGQRATLKGLFTLQDYTTWHPRRKLYDPAFNKSYLRSLVPAFNECVEKSLNDLKPFANRTSMIPLKKHIMEFSGNVISKVAFASDFNNPCDETRSGLKGGTEFNITSLVTTMFKAFQEKLYNTNFKIFHPFEAEGYRRAVRALRKVGKDCILKRIKMLDDGEEVPHDILTLILKSATVDKSVDIETLVDDFVTFYAAGQDTTASTLSFAAILVHQHPDVLERLLAEIDEVLGNKTSVSAEDLERLKYAEQILQETMRLYSLAGFMVVSKESPPGGIILSGYNIPAGTFMTTQASCIHRMVEHFSDPDAFNPSRFDPENIKPSPFVYFPFGVGHRACIGRHFAIMEMKLMLCRLVQTYKIYLPIEYKLLIAERFTRQPHDDIMCTLEARK